MPISKYQLQKQREQDAKILALYKTGATFRELAKVFKCSHTTVFNAVKRAEAVECGDISLDNSEQDATI